LNERELTAHHEAAHAVLARCLGHDVIWIQLRAENSRRPGYLGCVRRRPNPKLIEKACNASVGACQCERTRRAAKMVVAWGGPITDLRLGDEQTRNDLEDIAECAKFLSGDVTDTAIEYALNMKALATELVENNWHHIERLASLLMVSAASCGASVLKQKEIEAILGEPENPQGATDDVVRLLELACKEAA